MGYYVSDVYDDEPAISLFITGFPSISFKIFCSSILVFGKLDLESRPPIEVTLFLSS